MELFYTYLLKSSVSLVLFYAFYRLVVFQNTYFRIRRFTLLAILGFSCLYPLVDIAEWLLASKPVQEIVIPYVNVAAEQEFVMAAEAEAEVVTASATSLSLHQIGWILYLTGVGLLFARMVLQLLSICLIRRKATPCRMGDHTVLSLSGEEPPFSFFFWIFLTPQRYSTQEGEQILTHELTHARQYHSIDVLLSELFTIFFWFNPFVWLLKQEIRVNLEHLADAQVIQKGAEATSYQYSLLKLCHHVTSNKLVNNFNIPQFKRRIIMMNRDKSNKNSLLKYALLIPVAGLLIISGNAQAMINLVKSERIEQSGLNQEGKLPFTGKVVDEKGNPVMGANIIIKGTHDGTVSDPKGAFTLDVVPGQPVVVSFVGFETANVIPTSSNHKNVSVVLHEEAIRNEELVVVGYATSSAKESAPQTKSKQSDDSDLVFVAVEEMPQFPGGEGEMMRFLAQNIKYPVAAQKENVQGRVIVSYIVSKTGKVEDVKVIRGLSPELDAEAIRVISKMPDWIPGKQRGTAVNVRYTMPITFKLEKDSKPQATANTKMKPVVVMDGKMMPEDFNVQALNPETIENISVQKYNPEDLKMGKELLEKYGDRAKGGVILVTSKKV